MSAARRTHAERVLGPSNLVTPLEAALETGFSEEDAAAVLQVAAAAGEVSFTRRPLGRGFQVRYLWGEALPVLIRELGGGLAGEPAPKKPTKGKPRLQLADL